VIWLINEIHILDGGKAELVVKHDEGYFTEYEDAMNRVSFLNGSLTADFQSYLAKIKDPSEEQRSIMVWMLWNHRRKVATTFLNPASF